jgi:hypothetical protein
MTNRHRGPMIESNVAKACMGIEAAKVGLAEVHQNFVGTLNLAAVFPIVRLYDGVGKRILDIRSRQLPAPSQIPGAAHAMIGLAQSSIGSPSSPQ